MIRAILFGEFDTQVGPKLTSQHPAGFMDAATWAALYEYVIPPQRLCGHVLGISALGHRIVGVPTAILNDKYYRNALVFNCCFAFDEGISDHDVARHEPALRKISETLRALEVEKELVLRPALKAEFLALLPQIFEGLNSSGECAVAIPNTDATLRLSIVQDSAVPPDPIDSDVPWRASSGNEAALVELGTTAVQMYPHINGVNTVREAARQAAVDLPDARACVRELINRNFVATHELLGDLTYLVTPKLRDLYALDAAHRREFLASVAATPEQPPRWDEVFALFALIKPGVTPLGVARRFKECRVNAHAFVRACLEREVLTAMPDPHAIHDDVCTTVPPCLDNPSYSAIKEPRAPFRFFV
eukprot:m51a1_g7919 hypothetical protein (361) ;mRNA; f:218600-220298